MLAGHGGVSEGLQCLVHNEYNKTTRWYTFFRAEYSIRDLARKFRNAYQVVFFAACRQVFDTKAQSGCFKGPYQAAMDAYAAEKKGQEALKKLDQDKND